MIYSAFVLLFGVYIAQENPNLPRVKVLTQNFLDYMLDMIKPLNKNQKSIFRSFGF